jgi:hypothetical protein
MFGEMRRRQNILQEFVPVHSQISYFAAKSCGDFAEVVERSSITSIQGVGYGYRRLYPL